MFMLFLSCKAGNKQADTSLNSTLGGNSTPFVNEKWEQHVNQSKEQTKQLNCFPTKYEAHGPSRGTVILLHGFTACPQQFFEIGKKLSHIGYRVYIPLLPGHGLEKFKDNEYEELPNLENYSRVFDGFVTQINEIALFENLGANSNEEISPVSIGGLSLGGMLAVNAIAKKPTIYSNALILTPFFQIKLQN